MVTIASFQMVGYLKLESRYYNKDPATGFRRAYRSYSEKHRVTFPMASTLTRRWAESNEATFLWTQFLHCSLDDWNDIFMSVF